MAKRKTAEEIPVVPYTQLGKNRVDLSSLLPLPAPLSLFVEPTNVCNFRCQFCPESFVDYESQAGGRRTMSLEDFRKVCADIKALGRLKVLRFYMLGEPLLHRELEEFIRHAKDQDVAERIEVTSNGSALTPERSRKLVEAGLDYLRISIYASTEERHHDVTGSVVGLARLVANVSAFREIRDSMGSRKPYLFVKMIDAMDAAENARFFELFGSIADEIGLEPRTNWTGFEGRDLTLLAHLSDQEKLKLLPYPVKAVCPYPFYVLVVHADLDVSVCCADWNKKALVGNLRRQTLAEVWRSQELRDFQKMHVENRRSENESCRNCTVLFTHPDNLDGLSRRRYAEILGVPEDEIRLP